MRVRDLRETDIPILTEWAERSGFEYPQPNSSTVEKVLVVADDEDAPILAVAAKRLVEVFGWFDPAAGAELRMEAIRLVQGSMARALKGMGYDCAEVFIPPQLARRGFGDILRNHFGWYRNWPSWGKRL